MVVIATEDATVVHDGTVGSNHIQGIVTGRMYFGGYILLTVLIDGPNCGSGVQVRWCARG